MSGILYIDGVPVVTAEDIEVGDDLILSGTTSIITLESNTQTSGNVVSFKSSPGSSSTSNILKIEADGANWGAGAACLKIVSDDTQATPIRIDNGSGDVLTITRAGGIGMAADLSLSGGGTIGSTGNGNITISPDGTGVIIFDSIAEINNVLTVTPDAITATSETVAASVSTTLTEITTNGDSDLDNVSLANGTDKQIKMFAVVAVGNAADSVKITPASMIGGTQITFPANPLGLGCMMYYDAGVAGWIVIGNNGGTIA
jgi:hypothetical protein